MLEMALVRLIKFFRDITLYGRGIFTVLTTILILSGCIRFTPIDDGEDNSVIPNVTSPTSSSAPSGKTTVGSLRGYTFEKGTQFTMNSYVYVTFSDSDGDQSGKANWVKVSDGGGTGYISTSTENLVQTGTLRINTGTPKSIIKVEYNNGTEVVTVFANVEGGKASVDF